MSEWQPIETAPKDGSVIYAGKEKVGSWWRKIPYPVRSKWDGEQWACDFGDRWVPYDPQPTHWMPLPPPPSNSEGRE